MITRKGLAILVASPFLPFGDELAQGFGLRWDCAAGLWKRLPLRILQWGMVSMASLQRRASGRYRIIFTYSGDRFFVSLKTKNLKEATASLARLEENLHDLERGRISLPYGADLDVFLLSDGKL